jgi:hypothetical protein
LIVKIIYGKFYEWDVLIYFHGMLFFWATSRDLIALEIKLHLKRRRALLREAKEALSKSKTQWYCSRNSAFSNILAANSTNNLSRMFQVQNTQGMAA